MFARRPIAMNVGVDGQTERVPGELVSGTYFQVLGVGAAIGRVITPDDDKRRRRRSRGAQLRLLAHALRRRPARSSARPSPSTTTS